MAFCTPLLFWMLAVQYKALSTINFIMHLRALYSQTSSRISSLQMVLLEGVIQLLFNTCCFFFILNSLFGYHSHSSWLFSLRRSLRHRLDGTWKNENRRLRCLPLSINLVAMAMHVQGSVFSGHGVTGAAGVGLVLSHLTGPVMPTTFHTRSDGQTVTETKVTCKKPPKFSSGTKPSEPVGQNEMIQYKRRVLFRDIIVTAACMLSAVLSADAKWSAYNNVHCSTCTCTYTQPALQPHFWISIASCQSWLDLAKVMSIYILVVVLHRPVSSGTSVVVFTSFTTNVAIVNF